jgi:Xaa-Pro aminopeptidase
MSKISSLRTEMSKYSVDAYYIPMADAHQNEYPPESALRLRWLTDFTGSAGYCAVLKKKAAVFVDGRYTLQAKKQLDATVYKQEDYTKTAPIDWMIAQLKAGETLGYDPKILTIKQQRSYAQKCSDKGIVFKAIAENLVDEIWQDQPELPTSEAFMLETSLTGLDITQKIKMIADEVKGDYLLISALDSIAWLTNMRASDIHASPVFLSYAVLDIAKKIVHLFTDESRFSQALKSKISKTIKTHGYNALEDFIGRLSDKKMIALDINETSAWCEDVCRQSGVSIHEMTNPIALKKACKNKDEQDSIKTAHELDGAALSKFFAWFDAAQNKQEMTETSVEEVLYNFRAEANSFKGVSFDPISGFAENGAVIHYRAVEKTALSIKGDGLYLLDSGGQYIYGTTDLTRVVAVGKPTAEMIEAYTLVLKGHIALACAVFPEGTNGSQLDVLARQFLWAKGMDYAHGTGHGVGMFLNVHEGPAGISPRSTEPLRAGMLLSNEPGYYKEGEFGIRIENLVLVKETGTVLESGRKTLCFETVSLVPFDRRLIDKTLLTKQEIDWINAYHAKVKEKILPQLKEAAANWLIENTKVL